MRSEIVATVGNDPADASPGVGHVAAIPRDHMDVEMRHCLTGSDSSVEADVVAVGTVFVVELVLYLVDEQEEVGPFLRCRLPPSGDGPVGDDENMTPADGIPVLDGEAGPVAGDPRFRRKSEERGLEILG
jgi:hypothetical protein